jgi:RNA polymerase sigma factor (sigma-70 family)
VASGAMVLDSPAAVTHEATEADSDHELVAAVRRGDDRAFEALYTRYQRRISAYVYGMVKDYGRAEDITQEIFISALRRMRETERPIVFKPWVYEIAKNACIDQFRRTRRAEEISFDAGEGLGAADHGRLVASDPSPDAAIDAKQQLDHLCGAFDGLSDSHHEILVLRELEGLSYREIGARMGLSRPGVESTLFRARKRLTEEYDELVSGQRCQRIQSIIAATGGAMPGARDSRRLARHISHCQPCRRQAVAAGLDAAVMAAPARRRIAERVAAFLPLPGFLRSRPWFGGEQMVPVSEPMAAAWSKAVAAAATLIVAGVGVGVSPHSPLKSESGSSAVKPVAAKRTAAASSSMPLSERPASMLRDRPGLGTQVRASGGSASLGAPSRSEKRPGPGGPASGGAGRSAGSAPVSTPTLPGGVKAPAAPVGRDPARPSGDRGPRVPPINVPSDPIPTSASPNQIHNQVTETVGQTDSQVTETVGDTGAAVQETVDEVVSGATGGIPKP